jgi:RNA polymerase sigma-70 factor, ECF subfamily
VEHDLIQSAQRGDRDAFTALVGSRIDRMYGIAFRILRDAGRAEDAVQDALMVAWRDLKGLHDPDRLDAWLHRLLVHVCVAAASRERRRVANIMVLPLEGPPARDVLHDIFDRDLLERGFRRLPPDQRAILVLHHFVGQSHTEIAETLGIPTGTARSRLHHAHRAMRAALDADGRSPRPVERPT